MEMLLLVPILLLSFVVHEFAHAWVAWREGDPTAYRLGRVTLNPLPHIDPFGTILVPALLLASRSGFLIGWARPVPVDASQLRDPRWGDVRVSLAGVTANLLLALAFTVLAAGLVHAQRAWPEAGILPSLQAMTVAGIRLNFLLLVFNLLPVPPLDGSRVLYHLLPGRWAANYQRLQGVSMLIFLGLLLTGAISFVLWPAAFLERSISSPLIQWLT
ncbi:MAG TPA: site-2 protease family protein [Longimicrobiales bacterium]|nr:site-2 protease family protein [Longimicrobiales bacterium]